MTLKPQIQRIYTDGACSGNPGPGGWSVAAYTDTGKVHELGGREAKTTNNRMELQGAIAALQLLLDIQQTTATTLYTDSQYVKNGITKWITGWKKKGWKTSTGKEVVNIDLWKQLDALHHSVKTQLPLTWEYVRGHAGDVGNERSDAIARAFSKNNPLALHQVNEFKDTDAKPSGTPENPSDGGDSDQSDRQDQFPDITSTPSLLHSPAVAISDAHSSQQVVMGSEGEMATEKLQQLRNLVETLQMADTIAERHYLLTTTELADLVGSSVSTVTNRGDSWVWRNWLMARARQDGNQILWQIERIS